MLLLHDAKQCLTNSSNNPLHSLTFTRDSSVSVLVGCSDETANSSYFAMWP